MNRQKMLIALAFLGVVTTVVIAAPTEKPAPEKKPVDKPVASVNGQPILRSRFIDQMTLEYGKQTLDTMIAELVVTQEQERHGIQISEKELAAFIDRIVAGRISDERRRLKAQFGNAVTLESYYKNNSDITLDDLIAEMKSEYQVHQTRLEKELVVNRLSHYNDLTRESVQVQHILLATKDKAESVRQTLLEGARFRIVAQRESLDKLSHENGGELPRFRRGDWTLRTGLYGKAFEKAAMALKVGQISPVVKTDAGYHLIKMLDHTPNRVKRYDELKEKIDLLIVSHPVSPNRRNLCFERLRMQATITRTY